MVLPVWGGKMSKRKTNAWWRTKEGGGSRGKRGGRRLTNTEKVQQSSLRDSFSLDRGAAGPQSGERRQSTSQNKTWKKTTRSHRVRLQSGCCIWSIHRWNYALNAQFMLWFSGLTLQNLSVWTLGYNLRDHPWPPALLLGGASLTLHVASWRSPKVTFADWLGRWVHWTETVQERAGGGSGLPDCPSAALIRSVSVV